MLFIIFYNDFPDVWCDGSSIVYADDDTDNVSDSDPQILQDMIQAEADLSTSWVKDNRMVCSGSKTKLMIVGTRELRKSKLLNNNLKIEINVDGFKVVESDSERLLGLIMNNIMTWEHHIHGNSENKGLIGKLSYRASLIYRLSKIMPKNRLKSFAEGIFFAILNYGIEVYGNVWGINAYDEHERNSPSFTKLDNRKLQILVNKVLRCLTGMDRETAIIDLHRKSQQLSVQQRCAFFSVVQVHKSLLYMRTGYHFDMFNPTKEYRVTRRRDKLEVNYMLSISRKN